MITVKFDIKDSYSDFQMILSKRVINFPRARKTQVTIPGRDGLLDITESLTGSVVYDNRDLVFTFTLLNKDRVSEIISYLHGKRLQIVMSDDSDYHYVGRCEITNYEVTKGIRKLTITCDCDPYKINNETGVKSL